MRVVRAGDVINVNNNSLVVKRAFANLAAGTTAGTIVAGVSGRQILVLALAVICGGTATSFQLLDNSTANMALRENGANGGFVLPVNEFGWAITSVGQPLRATTGSGSATGVDVLYVEV